MRKLAIAAVLLLASLSLFAQEKPDSIYVFISNPEFGQSEATGTHYRGAFGIGWQHRFGERWSGELAVSRQRDTEGYTTFDHDGNVIERVRMHIDTTPVDLAAHYHFLNSGSWKPYLTLGARWAGESGAYSSQYQGAAGAGVTWQIRPQFGIRFDGRLLFGSAPSYVNRLNASAGVAWSF